MKNIFVFIFVISCAICCSLNNTFAQIINTFAGTGVIGNTGDGGQAIGAAINYPAYGAFDKFGNYYFATGTGGKTVRKISITGIISTIAGTG